MREGMVRRRARKGLGKRCVGEEARDPREEREHEEEEDDAEKGEEVSGELETRIERPSSTWTCPTMSLAACRYVKRAGKEKGEEPKK